MLFSNGRIPRSQLPTQELLVEQGQPLECWQQMQKPGFLKGCIMSAPRARDGRCWLVRWVCLHPWGQGTPRQGAPVQACQDHPQRIGSSYLQGLENLDGSPHCQEWFSLLRAVAKEELGHMPSPSGSVQFLPIGRKQSSPSASHGSFPVSTMGREGLDAG